LGAKLTFVCIFSFTCKAIIVASHRAGGSAYGSSRGLGLSALLAEALPAVLAAGLLALYHGRVARAGGGVSLADMGNAVPQEEAGITPITEDGKMWLEQFMNQQRRRKQEEMGHIAPVSAKQLLMTHSDATEALHMASQ
jgi:hypothetical protein